MWVECGKHRNDSGFGNGVHIWCDDVTVVDEVPDFEEA